MYSKKVKDVAERIGEFYLHKNNGDYSKTAKEIVEINFTKLEVTEDDVVIITTSRPGLLIGKKGENIVGLQLFLSKDTKIVEEMEPLNDLIIPYPPEYEDYDHYNYEEDPFYPDDKDPYEQMLDDSGNNHSHLDYGSLDPSTDISEIDIESTKENE